MGTFVLRLKQVMRRAMTALSMAPDLNHPLMMLETCLAHVQMLYRVESWQCPDLEVKSCQPLRMMLRARRNWGMSRKRYVGDGTISVQMRQDVSQRCGERIQRSA
jgi:hypothetical protein